MKLENVDDLVKSRLEEMLFELEDGLKADVISIHTPMFNGLEDIFRKVIRSLDNRKEHVAIILTTSGGSVEVVEQLVKIIRHYYEVVTFIVPDRAMSAGTIFVMSGDHIKMDYFSRLGPIDPQVQNAKGQWVPALSYLAQYERLVEKATRGMLTQADAILLNQLDLADLHSYEQAKDLSISLLKRWLTTYKFKDWVLTETNKDKVTKEMKERRAKEIAEALSDISRWYSHSRGIGVEDLSLLKLKIDDFGDDTITKLIHNYYELLRDYYRDTRNLTAFLHARSYP